MKEHTYAIIMAGGIGSRFWPFSRNKHPKQFHDILGKGKTLLQETVERFSSLCPKENIYIVTNKDYNHFITEQLPFLHQDQILLEPMGKNTAPCIAYATAKISSKDPEAICIVAPADHVIDNQNKFEQKIQNALDYAYKNNVLITLGIEPNRPDTAYGYIQYREEDQTDFKKVKTFTEKPEIELAQTFIDSGEFVWNAGIFVWKNKSIIESFRLHMPEMLEVFEEGIPSYFTEREPEFLKTAYTQCKNISIDYGVLEKADNVHVLLCEIGWSDLGTWKALYEHSEKDENDNVIDGNVMLYETSDCIIKAPGEKLVLVQGLEGYIIAEHNGVLMICKKEDEQRVKKFVSDVKNNNPKFV